MPINYILNLTPCQPNLRYLILCRLCRPCFRILRLNDIFVLVRLYYMSIWHSFVLFRVLFSFCCRVIDFSTKSQRKIFFCGFLIFSPKKFIDNSDVTCGFSNILTLPDKISKSDISERVITPNLFLNEKSKVSPYLFFKWKKRKSDYNGNKKILIFVFPDFLQNSITVTSCL